jgi:hypothetical protein
MSYTTLYMWLAFVKIVVLMHKVGVTLFVNCSDDNTGVLFYQTLTVGFKHMLSERGY